MPVSDSTYERTDEALTSHPRPLPSLATSLLPLLFLILALSATVYVFGSDSTGGAVQMVLVLSSAVAGFVAYRMGRTWTELQEGIKKSVNASLSAILILLLIGSLAGTWVMSGIVPTLIYYGLQLISPSFFLVAACLSAALISVATGSSWSTIATVGIALLGIGKALGLSEGLIGGAIISGAYFGDKVSPLSDTTNLAPAVAGASLFTHIRYMFYTTVPSMIITVLLFLAIGLFSASEEVSSDNILAIRTKLTDTFLISPWLLLVPLVVIGMIVRRVAAIPALLIGALLGAVAALFTQPELVAQVGGADSEVGAEALFNGTMRALYTEVKYATGHEMVDELLTTRGMRGMLNTVWLIICAISFGGTMEAAGFLQRIASEITKRAQRIWSLVASTTGTCFFFNVTAADQYLAIIIPGKMFEKVYQKRGLKPEVLSRTLEDTATVTSVLIPWNTCGATQSTVLGVATFIYAPYCFFNIISPFMTIFFAVFNIKIRRLPAKAHATTDTESEEPSI